MGGMWSESDKACKKKEENEANTENKDETFGDDEYKEINVGKEDKQLCDAQQDTDKVNEKNKLNTEKKGTRGGKYREERNKIYGISSRNLGRSVGKSTKRERETKSSERERTITAKTRKVGEELIISKERERKIELQTEKEAKEFTKRKSDEHRSRYGKINMQHDTIHHRDTNSNSNEWTERLRRTLRDWEKENDKDRTYWKERKIESTVRNEIKRQTSRNTTFGYNENKSEYNRERFLRYNQRNNQRYYQRYYGNYQNYLDNGYQPVRRQQRDYGQWEQNREFGHQSEQSELYAYRRKWMNNE